MADNRTRSKDKSDSVLGSPPTSRPERLGRARREVTAARVQPRGPRPAKPTPARSKAPSPRRPRKPAAVAEPKPAAVTAGCPPLERPKVSAPPPPRPMGAPSGTELVTTAIQATGELARIGLTVGGQVLKRAVDRIPRP
jgi:hypothetical protein